jgi:hypothetical protein
MITKQEKTEEENIKYLSKLKKIDLFNKLLQERKTSSYHIEKSRRLGKLLNENNKLTKHLKLKLKYITNKKIELINSLNINMGRRVFIEAMTPKGIIRTYDGFIVQETLNHINIEIRTFEHTYNYIIEKSFIKGMKIYGEQK